MLPICQRAMERDEKIVGSLPPMQPSAPPSTKGPSNGLPQSRPIHGRTTGPTRRSTRGQWTPEEDEILRKAVQRFQGKNWKKIAECFKDRTDVQCLHRWQKVLNPELIKGPWSKEEDEMIIQLVDKYGPKKWSTIAQHLPGRIGKQCRERWHNHLNPAINKEAWTQEEEIVLIRAHQIHGNRWAELTKYLPGRTDNAIKNHWNSSVKKKLDSYIASGLLAQFQGMPLVSHHSDHSIASASWRAAHNSSTTGSICKDRAEAEDNSECSQVGYSQTASDMSNTACQAREDFVLSEESNYGKVQTTSPTTSCSVQYCTSFDDITFTIPDTPYDFSDPSNYLEEHFSKDSGTYTTNDCNMGVIGLPNTLTFKLASESSSILANQFVAIQNQGIVHNHSHQSTEYVSALIDDKAIVSDVPGQKQAREECDTRATFSQEEADRSCANPTISSNIIDMDRYRELPRFQSSFLLSGTEGSIALQSSNSLKATEVEGSHCQNISSIPPKFKIGNDLMISTKEPDLINDSLDLSQAQEGVSNAGLIQEHNHSGSISHEHIEGFEQTDGLESSKLVHINTFGSETLDGHQIHPSVVQQAAECQVEQKGGTLCYEPPRFPSLDIPFFSCDLAQAGTEMLQEYSPLGIRRLMMPSMDCLTPLKLWDSPSSEGSPHAVLKSAAKTFACTPSILKKRHRDPLSSLSPFSERRYPKFLCASRLTKEFSCLEDQKNTTLSIEDKENLCPASTVAEERTRNDLVDSEKGGILEQDAMITVYEASEVPREILIERPLSDTQFSTPDGAVPKAGLKSRGRPSGADDNSKNTCDNGDKRESGTDKAGSVGSPCSLGERNRGNNFAVSTEMVDSLIGEVGAENLNIFGETPFRLSIESPSAWKSPWYFNSLVPGPRVDTDITIEDIGIFMSPGIGSLDAMGLMKQIHEQSADAYADAREVLGNETPESILRQRILKSRDSQHESRLCSASNILTEGRVLDFSECGTPTKSAEKRKSASGASLSSPSSYLLKNYR